MAEKTQATTEALHERRPEIGDEITVSGRPVTVTRLEPFESPKAPAIPAGMFGYARGHDVGEKAIRESHVGGVASFYRIDDQGVDE